MTEVEIVSWATSQGVAVVFSIIVLYMVRDMIAKMNENYCKMMDAMIAHMNKQNGKTEEAGVK